MNDQAITGAALHRKIHDELEHRLRGSTFDGGASEAHGLLCGLLTRGIDADRIDSQAGLFRLTDGEELEALRQLAQLAARDLEARESRFMLLLPPGEHSLAERTEALSSWCDGFMLGLYHDGEEAVNACSGEVREAVQDLVEITHVETGEIGAAEGERALMEIEEYARTVAQFLFEEFNQRRAVKKTRPPADA